MSFSAAAPCAPPTGAGIRNAAHRGLRRGLGRPPRALPPAHQQGEAPAELTAGTITHTAHAAAHAGAQPIADIAARAAAAPPQADTAAVSPLLGPPPLAALLLGGAVLAGLGLKRLYDTPSRSYDQNVGQEYDAWTEEGVLEYYWGEHIHLGYYTEEVGATSWACGRLWRMSWRAAGMVAGAGWEGCLATPIAALMPAPLSDMHACCISAADPGAAARLQEEKLHSGRAPALLLPSNGLRPAFHRRVHPRRRPLLRVAPHTPSCRTGQVRLCGGDAAVEWVGGRQRQRRVGRPPHP